MFRQISDGSVVVSRIETQQPTQFWVSDDGRRLCLVADFDRYDAVIELVGGSPLLTHVCGIARIDHYRVGRNIEYLEHCTHQVSFIFAVTIGFGKDFCSRMRTHSASATNTNLNRNVSDALNVTTNRPNFFQLCFGAGRQLLSLLRDGCIGGPLWIVQAGEPAGNFGPISISL